VTRRSLLLGIFAIVLAIPAFAQEPTDDRVAAGQPESGSALVWKWINFGVLLGGLGYLAAKNAPAFFSARTADIQKAIKDATGLKIEAEFRASEIDRKMATLEAEIRRMRDGSRTEMSQESARIDHDTSVALDKIREHTVREIEALQHQARNTLREHVAQLAVTLAGERMRERMTPDDRAHLVDAFARNVAAEGR
jgi:F0F1-type ATP synthase membrane subunit b/b'